MAQEVEQQEKRQGRDLSLDLIRALAGLLVIAVHFFLNSEFYYQPMAGKRMLLTTMARMGCMTCVPLFLLLTGYLNCHKELTRGYVKGLFRVLLTYLLASGVSFFYRWKWMGETVSLRYAVGQVLGYAGVPTGWYVEMYVGLFLLIPFLNMLWKGAGTRQARRALILVLLFLTCLPTLTNIKQKLLPAFWSSLYPVTYYYLGAWFRDYQPRVDWRWALPALAASVMAGGGAAYLQSRNTLFVWNDFSGWPGPTVACSACLLFLLLRQFPADKLPGWLKWAVGKGAELSLSMYMVSWCFDNALYSILRERVPLFLDRLPWFFVMVPAVYLCSALLAQLVEWARRAITWALNQAFPKLRLK